MAPPLLHTAGREMDAPPPTVDSRGASANSAMRSAAAPAALLTLIAAGTLLALRASSGWATFAVAAVGTVLATFLASKLVEAVPPGPGRGFARAAVRRVGLCVAAVFGALCLLEVAIRAHDGLSRRRLAAGHPAPFFLTIPPEWDRRYVPAPGTATGAVMWLGKLHVADADGMRRSAPYPPRRDDVFRIVVIGDSNTYGRGVEAHETYPAVLEAELRDEYAVEVFNLGVCGYSTVEYVGVARTFLERLDPDLVVVGLCLNDFVDGRPEPRGFAFPLPERVKVFFLKRTLAARVLEDAWDRAAMACGLRDDFFTDVVRRLPEYAPRLARDLRELNAAVVGAGKPAAVGIVVNQWPRVTGPSAELTAEAERAMAAAGMDVIPLEAFLRAHDGEDLGIGRFDGHPDPATHAEFARLLADHVRTRADLARHRRP